MSTNDSPKAKNNPTPGNTPKSAKADEEALVGGNKHIDTREVGDNYGINSPPLLYEENFQEGDYPGEEIVTSGPDPRKSL